MCVCATASESRAEEESRLSLRLTDCRGSSRTVDEPVTVSTGLGLGVVYHKGFGIEGTGGLWGYKSTVYSCLRHCVCASLTWWSSS